MSASSRIVSDDVVAASAAAGAARVQSGGSGVATFQVVVYTGAAHLFTRRDERWPLVAGSRATLLDVWKWVHSNQRESHAAEPAAARAPPELTQTTIDSIDCKANEKAIDWEHCNATDLANDVLRQYTYIKYSITENEETDEPVTGRAPNAYDSIDYADENETGGAAATATRSAGAGSARVGGGSGVRSRRRNGAVDAEFDPNNLEEISPLLHESPSAAAGGFVPGRCRYAVLAALLCLAVLYTAFCLRIFVVYRPLAQHCSTFPAAQCITNASNTCWEYAGGCYPNDPAYVTAESAGFGFAFLLLSFTFLLGTSLFGAASTRSCCVCTSIFGSMSWIFILLSAYYSYQAATQPAGDGNGPLVAAGWSIVMYLFGWILPVALIAWIARGTICCPI